MSGFDVSTYGPSNSVRGSYGPSNDKFQIGGFPGSSGKAQGPSASGAAAGPPAPPAEISHPLTGRVAPNGQLTFVTFDRNTPMTGTAREMLGELQKLFAYNETRAKSAGGFLNYGSARESVIAPKLRLAGGYEVQFAKNSDLERYLQRSAAALPQTMSDAALTGLFRDALGREPGTGEVDALRARLGGGETPAALRAELTASAEATNKLAAEFRAMLGRDAPAENMADMQARLKAEGGSHAGVRAHLAASPEATNRLAAEFQAVLGRAAPAENIRDMQARLAAEGGTPEGVRAQLAASPEAAATLTDAFTDTLGRELAPETLGDLQRRLAAGETLSGVRFQLATSTEATGKLNGAFASVLDRPAGAADVTWMQQTLAAGQSQDGMRATLAISGEATARLNEAFQGVLDRPAGAGDVTWMQQTLAAGQSLDGMRATLATSGEATVKLNEAFANVLGRAAAPENLDDLKKRLREGASQADVRFQLATGAEATAKVNGAFADVLGRPAQPGDTAALQGALGAGASQAAVRASLAGSGEASSTLGGLYEYALGRAPSSAELASAQAGLGGGGSLRGVYDGLIGPAAGLLGDAGKYDEALRQVRLPGGGTGGSGSAAGRALQGALAWAGRVGPSLVGRGAAGVALFVPFNAGQQALEVGVAGHPGLGARVERAPGQLSGTVVLYERGADGGPEGAGLRLDLGVDGRLSGPAGTPFAGLWFGTLLAEDMTRGVRLPPGFGAALAEATPEDVEGSAGGTPGSAGMQTGYSFELRTQEEADVVAALRAQGKGVQEIQAALDDVRASRGERRDPGFPLTVTGQVLPTPRDGVVGGVPTGEMEVNPRAERGVQESLRRQEQASQILAAASYRVERQPTVLPSDGLAPNAKPDIRLGNNIADIYSPTTKNLSTIRGELSGKVSAKQAFHLVLNLIESNASPDDVEDLLKRRPIQGLGELVIIEPDGTIRRLFPMPGQVFPGPT